MGLLQVLLDAFIKYIFSDCTTVSLLNIRNSQALLTYKSDYLVNKVNYHFKKLNEKKCIFVLPVCDKLKIGYSHLQGMELTTNPNKVIYI